jgi:hypothetical protein
MTPYIMSIARMRRDKFANIVDAALVRLKTDYPLLDWPEGGLPLADMSVFSFVMLKHPEFLLRGSCRWGVAGEIGFKTFDGRAHVRMHAHTFHMPSSPFTQSQRRLPSA